MDIVHIQLENSQIYFNQLIQRSKGPVCEFSMAHRRENEPDGQGAEINTLTLEFSVCYRGNWAPVLKVIKRPERCHNQPIQDRRQSVTGGGCSCGIHDDEAIIQVQICRDIRSEAVEKHIKQTSHTNIPDYHSSTDWEFTLGEQEGLQPATAAEFKCKHIYGISFNEECNVM